MVRWLLESGVRGLGLTKTHAPQRATVRDAAARWPHWWNRELFGPPHREADMRVPEATHGGLRRLRLMSRRRETLHTTARGRQLLAESDALLEALHEDLGGGGGFEADAWTLIEEGLHDHGPMAVDRLTSLLAPLLRMEGWRDADGAPLQGASLLPALHPLLWRAEGYVLVRRPPGARIAT